MSSKPEDSTFIQVQSTSNGDQGASAKKRKVDKKLICFWIQVTVFLMAVGITVASFKAPSLRHARLRGLATWQWCLLLSALLSGPIISKVVVEIILLFIDREYSVMDNTIYYVVGLIESAWVVLWFSMILIAWIWVVNEPSYLGVSRLKHDETMKKLHTTLPFVDVTLIGFIVGSFLWFLKQLALLKAKGSFHLRRFYTRIKKALMQQYVIDKLSHSPNNKRSGDDDQEKNVNIKEYDEEDRQQYAFFRRQLGTTAVNLSKFDNISQEEVSCWGMRTLIKGITNRRYLTYRGNEKIDTEDKAKDAANDIFNLVLHKPSDQPCTSTCIGDEELKPYFRSKDKRDQVLKILKEGADADQINEEVFTKWMVKAFKYREGLVKALEANKKMFQALNIFVNVLLFLLIVALWLIMLKNKTRKVIFVFGASLVGAAAILGDACKKLIDSLLFVFLVHPFDIGDWCLIGDTPVMIEEINVLSTVALTNENEMRHYSNVALASMTITNYCRSSHICDFVEFYSDIDTPLESLEKFQDQITSYIEQNKHYWQPRPTWLMELVQIEGMSKIKMTVQFKHTINYEEFNERQSRKTQLVKQMKRKIDELLRNTTSDNLVPKRSTGQ